MNEIFCLLKSSILYEPETLGELFSELTFGQFVGVVSFFVTLILMVILSMNGKLPFDHKVDDFIDEAKMNGNVVVAHRRSLQMRDTSNQDKIKDRQYTGVYEFELNGKKKKTTVVLLGNKPPLKINVYYSEKTGKYMTEYESRTTFKNAVVILLPLIVAVAVTVMLGG